MEKPTLKNSVLVNGERKKIRKIINSRLDYMRGLAHGRTGEDSIIELDQSEHYYEGVLEGRKEFDFFNY